MEDQFFFENVFTFNLTQETGYRNSEENPEAKSNDDNISEPKKLKLENSNEIIKKEINYDVEALNYVTNPTDDNIFSINFEYYEEKLLKENKIKTVEQYVRDALEGEISSQQRSRILIQDVRNSDKIVDYKEINQNISYSIPPMKIEELPRAQSPDLFKDYLEESNNNYSNDEVNNEYNNNDEIALDLSMPNKIYHTQSESELKVSTVPLSLGSSFKMTKQAKKYCRKDELKMKIEKFIIQMLEKLVKSESIEITIRDTLNFENVDTTSGILSLKASSESTHRTTSINKNRGEYRFSVIMSLISEIYHLLLTGTRCTTRELYYKDPNLFDDQITVNNAIREICCLFEAAPWEIGIQSTVKGLIAGCLVITLSSGEIIDYLKFPNGTILSSDSINIIQLKSTAEFVLLVEKDTVFEKLLQNNILNVLKKDIILITGKGYPDINTRIILKKIYEHLRIPIYALVDADPFGIEIYLVYRYGSKAMSYNSDTLACPSIIWIGIRPSEIDFLSIDSITLTTEDKNKIKSLLKRPYINKTIKAELEILMTLNKKAEIEGLLSSSQNFFAYDYILNKINQIKIIDE